MATKGDVIDVLQGTRSWSLSWNQMPAVENAHRTMHYRARAEYDRTWRQAFALLAREARLPTGLAAVTVDVTHERPNRRSLPDPAACAPSAKAALDGLVDYGLIPDDGPEHVHSVTFRVAVTGRHALTIRIEPVPFDQPAMEET
jgi:crossover junction endodeoxyribonuclease RusA